MKEIYVKWENPVFLLLIALNVSSDLKKYTTYPTELDDFPF
jgi:hypothetical protein